MLQLIEQAQVLLPSLINRMQDKTLVERRHDILRLSIIRLAYIHLDLINTASINHRHHYILIVRHGVRILHNHRHSLVSISRDDLTLLLETLHRLLIDLLSHLVHIAALITILRQRELHSQDLKELLTAVVKIMTLHDMTHTIPYHVSDIHAETLTHESMTTLLIDYRTLLVHHIIILKQTLAHTEVILLHLLLRILDRTSDHAMLNHLTLLEAQSVHDLSNTLAGKETHQLVLKRHIEHRRARITLTSRTTTKLTVHTTALMTLSTNDGKTSSLLDLRSKLDVSTATSHIRSNRHRAQTAHTATSLLDDISLLLVQLGIKHLMRNLTHLQHTRQQLTNLHTRRTNQHRPASITHTLHLIDHRHILLTLSLIDTVIHIRTNHLAVGRYLDHIKLIDVPKLTSLSHRSTRHTSKFVIHTEIVLQSNRSISLRRRLHLDMLLSLHSLVQAITPATSLHDTPRLLIDNLNLTILNHILIIEIKHRISLEQLLESMHTLALERIVIVDLVLTLYARLIVERLVSLNLRHHASNVRQDKKRMVVHLRSQPVITLVSQIHTVLLLVDHEIQRLDSLRHTAVIILHINLLSREQPRLDARLREILNQSLILRQSLITAIQREETTLSLFLVIVSHTLRDSLLSLSQILSSQSTLYTHETLHQRLILLIHLIITLRHRTRDNQRSTSIINQHRVHLIDDSIVMLALHQVSRILSHIVAQVVKAKLIVRTESDVSLISIAASHTIRLMLVNTIHTQTVEHINRSHPLRVTLGKIIIDRHHVHTIARQSIQEDRQSSRQSFTLTSKHLSNLALMQHRTAKKLHIKMHHVPQRRVAASHPLVVIHSRVTINIDKIMLGSQLTVKIRSLHTNISILRKTLRRTLDDSKDLSPHLVEHHLKLVKHILFQLVNLMEQRRAVLNVSLRNLRLDTLDLLTLSRHTLSNHTTNLLHTLAQLIIAQSRNLRINIAYSVHQRTVSLIVTRLLVAK